MKTMVAALAVVACAVALPVQAGSPGPADHPAHAADACMTEKEATFALFKAADTGDAEQVQAALDAGGDPNRAYAKSRLTPLHFAASVNTAEVVALLLDAGADPNVYDKRGLTPLHWAAGRNSGEAVGLLLDAGADPMARDANGNVPMDYAGNNARFVGTDVYQRLLDATKWGSCLERMGDHDTCSALRGLAGISEELSAIQEMESQTCEVENWSYEYLFNTVSINGTTTCESGDMRLQVFDGDEFLGVKLAPVWKGMFSVLLDVVRKPRDLNIKAN